MCFGFIQEQCLYVPFILDQFHEFTTKKNKFNNNWEMAAVARENY